MEFKYEVDLQPTEEQIAAGIQQLLEEFPDIADQVDDDSDLEDAVVFIWQAMLAAK